MYAAVNGVLTEDKRIWLRKFVQFIRKKRFSGDLWGVESLELNKALQPQLASFLALFKDDKSFDVVRGNVAELLDKLSQIRFARTGTKTQEKLKNELSAQTLNELIEAIHAGALIQLE